jgi:hypothetical protein
MGLVLFIAHCGGNMFTSLFCEECNSAIAPGGEVWDSSEELLSNETQILKIESPFGRVNWS